MSWLSKGVLCASVVMGTYRDGQAAVRPADNENRAPKITILSFSYAQIDEPVRQEVEERITKIFLRVGVQVEWEPCPTREGTMADYPNCRGFGAPDHYSLHILPHGRKELKGEVAGESFAKARLVNIFWDRVQEEAARYRVPTSEMLAAITAHEIGHLLLGSNSHAPLGIMMGRWNTQALTFVSQGGLGFTQKQAQQIRAALGN